ncbi:uncharacterized protein LOC133462609 isoform X2 [Cololabis saira]|uniref:uncharacterized protein LOC133462609 isoform X2 n=1 Tax=Cololabis saira TaxID=129043 RepID=UPI002AD43A50|nr:uncharacterized protein LOC133462609 isoform X2 [Cololabis saira]
MIQAFNSPTFLNNNGRRSSSMNVLGIWWCVMCTLVSVGPSGCVNEADFEVEYGDDYGNEISLDQQEGESPAIPSHADVSRWDKLFIALEDSHMRQNMLLESLEPCCGGVHALRTQVDKLAKGTCQHSAPDLASACRAQAEQASLRLHHSLKELREEGAERERRINATLQMILHSRREDDARVTLFGETSTWPDSTEVHRPTPRPGPLGRVFSSVIKLFPSTLKEQEAPSQVDLIAVKRELVTIATGLQRVHLQLRKVIEQAGLREDRGDA